MRRIYEHRRLSGHHATSGLTVFNPKICGTAKPKTPKPFSRRRNIPVSKVILAAPRAALVTLPITTDHAHDDLRQHHVEEQAACQENCPPTEPERYPPCGRYLCRRPNEADMAEGKNARIAIACIQSQHRDQVEAEVREDQPGGRCRAPANAARRSRGTSRVTNERSSRRKKYLLTTCIQTVLLRAQLESRRRGATFKFAGSLPEECGQCELFRCIIFVASSVSSSRRSFANSLLHTILSSVSEKKRIRSPI